MSSSNQLFEGIGAPVNVSQTEGQYIDPTLDSCCQREIESNRKQNAVEKSLRANDRVAKAENQRRQYQQQTYNEFNLLHNIPSIGSGCRCCYDPNTDGGEYELLTEAKREREEAAFAMNGGNDDIPDGEKDNEEQRDNSDSDDEFDYLLDEYLPTTAGDPSSTPGIYDDLQFSRRAELENQAYHFEVAKYHGYGVHRQMFPQRVFSSAGYGSDQKRDVVRPKGSVLHLYDPYSQLSVSLDLCLEEMATRYHGTKFVRGIGITSMHFAEDGDSNSDWKRDDLPMLLAIRDGKVVAWSSGLRDFKNSEDEVEPRACEQFLENAGVLYTSLPPLDTLCNIRPEEEALLENMKKLNGLGSLGMRGELSGRNKDDEDLEAEKEQRYDCGVKGCCKSFAHEHVGVKTDEQDGLVLSEMMYCQEIGVPGAGWGVPPPEPASQEIAAP